jgi:hypothetical protein
MSVIVLAAFEADGAGGLHLDEELAGPEEINAALAAFDAVFVDGVHGVAVTAEDVEKIVEKTFGLGFFALGAVPAFGEGEGAGAHLFAGEGEDGGR